MKAPTIVRVRSSQLVWPFSGDGPEYHYGKWGRISLDPFPAYAHDRGEVEGTLGVLIENWPPETALTVHVAEFEDPSRTNGWTQAAEDSIHIFLSGKRIPPHPAMTRYLVAHEYGHAVETWLNRRSDNHDGEVLTEYRTFRSQRAVKYGGGVWHRELGEIFACDFRILVAGTELEFWPHPGVDRPEEVDGLSAWWEEARP